MKITQKTLMWPIRKRKAVSPVIAVILLIGLTVLAAALMFFIVLPMFNPPPDFEISQSYIEYNDELTITEGDAWGQVGVTIRNTGQVAVKIGQVNIYYYTSNASGNFANIIDNVFILGEGFTDSNPLEIPATQTELVNINFRLPDENVESTVQYKIDVVPSNRAVGTLSTDYGTLSLSKDEPNIILDLDAKLRRGINIEPIVSDNSDIKNVTYTIYNATDLLAIKTITSAVEIYNWNWETRVGEEYGFANGDYLIEATVHDYAGNLASVNNSFTLDNDYVDPTVVYYNVTLPYTDGTVEVGNSVTVEAQIIDTGCDVSDVKYAFIYYRNGNDTWTVPWQKVSSPMTIPNELEPNNFIGTISSAALNHDSMTVGNLQIAIEVIDDDENTIDNKLGGFLNYTVVDNFEPDISHTPVVIGTEYESIVVSATITDKDLVDVSTATLFYRFTNDVNANVTSKYYSYLLPTDWVSLQSNIISGDSYQWNIPSSNVTIHGIDYYLEVNDDTGNLAFDGTDISPWHVTIPDDLAPLIIHTTRGSWSEDQSLDITCSVDDNDPGFGATGTYLSPTGEVTLYYRDYDGTGGPYNSIKMTLFSGNTSDGGLSTWNATIPGVYFEDDADPTVDYYFVAIDYSGLSSGSETVYSLDVTPAGVPFIEYVENSASIEPDSGDSAINFEITNSATGVATGILIGMKAEITGFVGNAPLLNHTIFDSSVTAWELDEGAPTDTWIVFTENITMVAEGNRIVTLVYETVDNLNQSYDLHGLTFSVIFKVYHSAVVDEQEIDSFNSESAEPPYSNYSFYNEGDGYYYIQNWLDTPIYSTGGSWYTQGNNPWIDPYATLSDTATGVSKPYIGSTIPSGDRSGTWQLSTNSGGSYSKTYSSVDTQNEYIWLYVVVTADSAVTINLRAEIYHTEYYRNQFWQNWKTRTAYGGEEGALHVNSDSLFTGGLFTQEYTSSVSLNQGNNYILFGVHRLSTFDANDGSFDTFYETDQALALGFSDVSGLTVKIYTGAPASPMIPTKIVSDSINLNQIESTVILPNSNVIIEIHQEKLKTDFEILRKEDY